MQYRCNLFKIFLIFFISSVFLVSCDSGGDSSSSGGTNTQTATLKGTIADVVAKEQTGTKSFLIAKLNEIFTFSKNAVAQDPEVTDLSGITVQAFDEEENLVGEGESDENGNFEFTVPCDVPLTLLFSLEGSSVELGPIVVPCPEGEEEAVLFITVDLNFDDEGGDSELDVEEEEDITLAQISCDGQAEETLDMEGESLVVEADGEACIITAGGCKLEIIAASVELTGCSTCIDTRGNSEVEIETEKFTCVSDEDGIRSVGTSTVEVELVAPEPSAMEVCDNAVDDDGDDLVDCDDPDCTEDLACPEIIVQVEGCPEEDPECMEEEAQCSSFEIESAVDGIDARGNSSVEIEGEDDDDENGEESTCSEISIVGGENSIKAVGNSEVEIEGTSCNLDPDEPLVKGNAEVEVECNGDDDDDDE